MSIYPGEKPFNGIITEKQAAFISAFTPEEFGYLLETAYTALQDADIFDTCAENMDVSDTEMVNLRDKLETYLNGKALAKLLSGGAK